MKYIKSGKAIGLRIKQRRKELGISQEKLAEALDVSYQQIQRYENATNLLNTDKLQLIADFLDIPVGYFFEEHPKMAVAEETGKFIPSKAAKFLRLFRRLNEKYRKAVLLFMELAADVRKG